MSNRLSTLFVRAKEIYQNEGIITLIKRALTFLISWFSYDKSTFYVDGFILKEGNEADFLPKIQNFTFKIVETNQQLDGLIKDGFDLSLMDIIEARQRLDKRAIAALIFIGCELAFRGWMAVTEEAKSTFNRYPYKVDFANKEACTGDAWTNPKYRRQGLYTYGYYKRREYLMAKGIKRTRAITNVNNIAAHRADNGVYGYTIYAKASYLRIGRLQYWKETQVNSIENKNDKQIEYQV